MARLDNVLLMTLFLAQKFDSRLVVVMESLSEIILLESARLVKVIQWLISPNFVLPLQTDKIFWGGNFNAVPLVVSESQQFFYSVIPHFLLSVPGLTTLSRFFNSFRVLHCASLDINLLVFFYGFNDAGIDSTPRSCTVRRSSRCSWRFALFLFLLHNWQLLCFNLFFPLFN